MIALHLSLATGYWMLSVGYKNIQMVYNIQIEVEVRVCFDRCFVNFVYSCIWNSMHLMQ